MNSKKFIKATLYNKGKKDLKHSFESQFAIESLKKKKTQINKNFSEFLAIPSINPPYVTATDFLKFQHVENSFENNVFLTPVVLPDGLVYAGDVTYEQVLYKHLYESYVISNLEKNLVLSDNYFTLESIPKINNSTKARADEISRELRELKYKFKNHPSRSLIFKIKELVHELHSLVDLFFRKNKNFLKSFIEVFGTTCQTDFRSLLRRRVRTLFKCFNDFSGSEEDEPTRFKTSSQFIFNFVNRKLCIIKQKLSNQLISGLIKFNPHVPLMNESF